MKKLIVVTVIMLLLAVSGFAGESGKQYPVSQTDVNRIICPEAVSDVIFSEEKGLTSKVVGNEIFIKFPVTITVDQETLEKSVSYGNEDAEVFLVCGGTTYNILLKPAKIPAQTIEIKAKEIIANEFKGKDTEEVLGALMVFAIEDNLPKSFKTEDKSISYSLAKGGGSLNVIYRKVSSGSGYSVKEFHIYSQSEVTVLPTELIAFPEVTNPLAASLTAEKFRGWTRGFIIEASK